MLPEFEKAAALAAIVNLGLHQPAALGLCGGGAVESSNDSGVSGPLNQCGHWITRMPY